MGVRHPRRGQPEKPAVQLAVDAVVGPDPLGSDVVAIDPHQPPSALMLAVNLRWARVTATSAPTAAVHSPETALDAGRIRPWH